MQILRTDVTAAVLSVYLGEESIAHTQLSIVDILPQDEIDACQRIADERGIYLKIRKFSA